MMPSPKNPAKDAHVSVTLNSEQPGDFRIEPSPPGSLPTGANGDLIFENDGHNGFFVHFHLIDPNCLGYRFPPQSKIKDSVWSELVDGGCPQAAKWDVFDPRNVSTDGMTLTVRNPNVKPTIGKFGYALRVTKDGGSTYLPLDPGGDNKNGPITGTSWSTALVFIGGALAGSLATLGGQALISG